MEKMLRLDWNLVFTIINLVVLYLLLRKFLIRPITDIMEKRKAMIEEGLNDANHTKEQALALKQQYEGAMNGAKLESGEMIEQAKKNAQAEYSRIVNDADIQAGKILKTARETVHIEREQTMREMQSQIASLAMVAARKIAVEQSSGSGNQAVYDQFLEEAGDPNDDTDNG